MNAPSIDYFGLGQLFAEVMAEQAGVIARNKPGDILGQPTYELREFPTLIFERINTGPFLWACYSKDEKYSEFMTVGYGQTIDQAKANFHDQYAEESP